MLLTFLLATRNMLTVSVLGLLLGHTLVATYFGLINANTVITKRHPNTTLLLVGTRHGHRNPAQFLPAVASSNSSDRGWGYEGELELTSIGKQQAFGLGQALRDFSDTLLAEQYKSEECQGLSSSANRCQMTLQAVLAGLYPPVGYADWSANINWSPIPYTVNDPLLRMYKVDCPLNEKVWEPIDDENLPEFVNLLKHEENILISYVATKTGWNASITTMAAVADNIDSIMKFNETLPDWMPTSLFGSEENLTAEILKFQEMPTIACAKEEACRELMGGVWLDHLLDTLLAKATNNATHTDLKLVAYASHTEVTLSVMKLLQIQKEELDTSAGFIIEYRDFPSPSVRILTHDPDPSDPTKHVITQGVYTQNLSSICQADFWCPLGAFEKMARPDAIEDWPKTCGVETKCNDTSAGKNQGRLNAPSAVFAGFLALFVVHLMTF